MTHPAFSLARSTLLLIAALAFTFSRAFAGEVTVTGTVVVPSTQVVRDADGTEHAPGWEIRFPVWSPPPGVSLAALERVDVTITPTVRALTTVQNLSGQTRPWWQYSAGVVGFLTRQDVSAYPDPRASGLRVHEGPILEYGTGGDVLGPNETRSGLYAGPQQLSFSIPVGEGDRAGLLEWARPTPGLGGQLRRFYSVRAVADWAAEWAGHGAWTARVEAGWLYPSFTVRYVYRDQPTGRTLFPLVGPWHRTPPVVQQGSTPRRYEFEGLPADVDPADVARVVVEVRTEHWVHSLIENTSPTPGQCGGGAYSCDNLTLADSISCGMSFQVGVGGGPQAFTAWDGATDWSGSSGLSAYATSPEQTLQRWDSDNPYPGPGALSAFQVQALKAPTIALDIEANPYCGVYPQSVTPGVEFAWDGRTAQATSFRVTYYLR